MAVTIASLVAKIGADVSGLTAGLATAHAKVTAFGGSLKSSTLGAVSGATAHLDSFGTSATRTGLMLSLGLTAPITAVGAASLKSSMDFDQGMRNVNSIAKLTEPTFEALRKSVLSLANDPRVTDGPVNLAKGLYDVVSSGFEGKKALEVLKVGAMGAAAGMSDTATSSKVLMAVLNSGIPGVHSAKEAMDVLFKEVDVGVNSFGELAGSLGDVLPMAKVAGVTLQEVTAGLAVMTRGGISAAESTTALNQLINHIVKPSKQAAGVMKEYGIESGITALQHKGLAGWLKEATEKTHGNKQALVEMMPEIRGMKALLSLTKDGGKDYTAMLGQMKTASEGIGSTQKALNEQLKGGQKQWESFKSSLEVLKISIGDALLPVLKAIIPPLQSAVLAFQGMSTPVKTAIVVFAALAAAAGPVLLVIGAISQAMVLIGPILTAAIAFFGNLGAALSLVAGAGPEILTALGLVAEVLGGPLVIGVTAAVAAVAGLVLAWKTNFGGIRDYTAQFIGWLSPYLTQAWNGLKSLAETVWGAISRFVKDIWPPIVTVVKWGMGIIGSVLKAGMEAAEVLFEGTWGNIKGIFIGVWDVLKGVVKIAWGVIAGVITVGLKLLAGDWKGAWNSLKDYVKLVWDGIEDVIGGALRAVGNTLAAGVKMLYNVGRDLVRGLVEGIKSGVGWVVDAAKGVAKSAVDAAKSALGIRSPSTVFRALGVFAGQGLALGLKASEARTAEAAKGVAQTMINAAQGVLASVQSTIQGADIVGESMVAARKKLLDQMAKIGNDLKGIFQGAFEDIFQHGFGNFFTNIIGGFRSMLARMASDYLSSQLVKLVGGLIGNAIGGANGKSIKDFFGGFRADGGAVETGRSYVVGERGPEIVTMGGNGFVTPNPALAGGGGGNTVIFNITTPNAQSFGQSQGQLMANAKKQMDHWTRRNG